LLADIQEFAKDDDGDGRLATERELLARAIDDVQAIAGQMVGFLTESAENPPEIYKVGLNTGRLLYALGDLIVGWLLLRQATIALAALDDAVPGEDSAFYTGKIASAAFFARQVLPPIGAQRAIAAATDNSLMDLPEDAF
jgi:hypothetical protein